MTQEIKPLKQRVTYTFVQDESDLPDVDRITFGLREFATYDEAQRYWPGHNIAKVTREWGAES